MTSTNSHIKPVTNLQTLSNAQPLYEIKLFQKNVDFDAYLTLPRHLSKRLLKTKRIVLVANNPSINEVMLDKTLNQGDMIVLFNHFIQADYFANNLLAKQLFKLLFFRQIGDSLLHFGLPPRHNNLPAIEKMLKHNKVGFLFGNDRYHFPTLADDPSPEDNPIDNTVELNFSFSLQSAINNDHYTGTLPDTHPVVADYPTYEHIHSSAPSSGFLIYRLMLAIKTFLDNHYEHSLQIVLIGFNHDKKTDYFWHGHNWAFEREEMSNLPDGVTRIKAI